VRQFGAKPWTPARALRAFTDLHLAMRRCLVSGLPPQWEQLTRLIQEASPLPERIREAALERLERLPDGDALCHGDYHPDNALMTLNGPIIIDWGSASKGHPLVDVARTESLLQMGELSTPQSMGWLLEAGLGIRAPDLCPAIPAAASGKRRRTRRMALAHRRCTPWRGNRRSADDIGAHAQ
jgi:hypothetical protein